MKNALESIKNRADQMEEGVSELKDKNIEGYICKQVYPALARISHSAPKFLTVNC